MAILHAATITPTKPELLASWLGGPVEVVASYRFDDPAGEVGVEAFVVRYDDRLRHVVLTYRGAPLPETGPGADDARMVGAMEHSVLGRRWVYDGTTDPVAVDCFRRAVLGDQHQAVLEVWKDGELVATREPTARLHSTAPTATTPPVPADATLRIVRDLGEPLPDPALVVAWDGGEAAVATLGVRAAR
ncbi:hypothetical protein [Nocardioides sp. TF02-7]|uniref:maltokinase N-terminal cap-like domain-containing protein n=1 Tax=Nocardioides sp. TF02-7 TaxID=2917724 RepID=UPI001F06C9E0|nr:hypothetical protein [Nocardioides sp. TF02-7]UMG92357.1 hypothetical protein MF408_21115 [Nocardioides sp. TF02-7]